MAKKWLLLIHAREIRILAGRSTVTADTLEFLYGLSKNVRSTHFEMKETYFSAISRNNDAKSKDSNNISIALSTFDPSIVVARDSF